VKKRVLFVCIHNSARSQMAEKFLNELAGDSFEAESAGLEPGKLNPFVVKAMAEAGYDISGGATKSVADMLAAGRQFDHVVAVCDKEAADKCPIFPGSGEKQHWPFSDPSSFKGSDEEKTAFAAKVRDQIKSRVEKFIKETV